MLQLSNFSANGSIRIHALLCYFMNSIITAHFQIVLNLKTLSCDILALWTFPHSIETDFYLKFQLKILCLYSLGLLLMVMEPVLQEWLCKVTLEPTHLLCLVSTQTFSTASQYQRDACLLVFIYAMIVFECMTCSNVASQW